MITAVSRALIIVAGACLGETRRDWAAAMEEEYEAAAEDGHPLSFALGCLTGTVRDMTVHQEGRFVLASHAVVLGVLLPIAASFLSALLIGFPYLDAPEALLAGSGGISGVRSMLNEGNTSAAPALALLVLMLTGLHLLVGWAVLNRDWPRVQIIVRLSAAATVTLSLFTGVIFLEPGTALMLVTALAIEVAAVWTLARWHEQLATELR